MKRQLNFLNVSLAQVFFTATLLVITSCTQDEAVENIDDTISINEPEVDTNNLASKKKGKKISACNNPGGYQLYTYGETSSSNTDSQDLVSKTAQNGIGVDVIRFLDDRTCKYNYSQSGNRGIYRIAAGSNKYDAKQPRIERATKTVNRKKGNFVSVEGTVKIKRVGNKATGNYPSNDPRDQRGTYIIQAKGTHSHATIGSIDPAIMLVLAKDKGNGTVDLWSEQITKRGGSSNTGREMKFIKNVAKNTTFKIKMVNGWSTDTKQYVKIYINGRLEHTHNVPNTKITKKENGEDVIRFQTGKNAKIRFGVYRCHKGEANIEWSNVKHNFKG
ncbi:hypothetical protein [Hyunsoonleella pacifica]|uniref:PL28 ulvan lyase domain-containing protein n=1 Tax=Hyunsoonleella pacifica TaxID=1080224 RepID=A0A4Q9FVV6_9FLAO|nr:hypothetical protein [Hyunsoonleella pacifica]TBN18745.1 hypothetical protein EYD46_01385 [Hyunsoonleella pacifica]GGD04357.1 hypothetical protein GCM10011368_02770 [Hyunsoonleella pacifica]